MARNEFDTSVFWREYEEKCGEKILARGLGRYLGGWDDCPQPLWGLVILTEGNFLFHHFAQDGWFNAITRAAMGDPQQEEKLIVIKRRNILSAGYMEEKNLLKKLLTFPQPLLTVCYSRPDGSTGEIQVEVDKKAQTMAAMLQPDNAGAGQLNGP